jgi:hypothetical protein
MSTPHPEPDPHDAPANERTHPFGWLSLAVIVALVVGGWFVIQRLTADTQMQDCIQSGRRNCARIPDNR